MEGPNPPPKNIVPIFERGGKYNERLSIMCVSFGDCHTRLSIIDRNDLFPKNWLLSNKNILGTVRSGPGCTVSFETDVPRCWESFLFSLRRRDVNNTCARASPVTRRRWSTACVLCVVGRRGGRVLPPRRVFSSAPLFHPPHCTLRSPLAPDRRPLSNRLPRGS